VKPKKKYINNDQGQINPCTYEVGDDIPLVDCWSRGEVCIDNADLEKSRHGGMGDPSQSPSLRVRVGNSAIAFNFNREPKTYAIDL